MGENRRKRKDPPFYEAGQMIGVAEEEPVRPKEASEDSKQKEEGEAEGEEEGRTPVVRRVPIGPSRKEREEHMATHTIQELVQALRKRARKTGPA